MPRVLMCTCSRMLTPALREQILQDVWGFDYLGDSNLVDVRIKYLRDKLEFGGRARLIQTVRGAGYALRG